MRLSIQCGVTSALLVALTSSCGGSEFTGQAAQQLPDASAGGSLGTGGSDGSSGTGSGGSPGAGGDSGRGGDSGHGGDSGDGGTAGRAGSSSVGSSGTGTDAGVGTDGAIGIDAAADANCASPMNFFLDLDGDGYGTQAGAVVACARPAGSWADRPGDCNDANKDINPEQKSFFGTGYDAKNGLQFDYDCNGREEADTSQFGAAPDCAGLNLGACRGSGFGPTNRNGAGIDPLCGSTVLVECKVVDVVLCGSTVTQVSPKRCR